MSMHMNVFRILADVSHTASKGVLIWAIHSNKSAEGVSLVTQILYGVVFCTRYLDLFWVSPRQSWWNFILKNVYIWTSIYIVALMTRVYARTREREKAWKFGGYLTGGSLILAPLAILIFYVKSRWTISNMIWAFSVILESVCVIPQLLLLRQTTVPTVIDSYYLVLLGSYRALYLLNWIYRGLFTASKPDGIAVLFGIIQTAFYVDFAWVYYTRQRVKLRGGGIVDSEDLRKGWLVNRVIPPGRPSTDEEDPEEADVQPARGTSGEPRKPNTNRWGVRGVSISADDTLHDHHKTKTGAERPNSESAERFNDEDAFLSDEDDDAPQLDLSGKKTLNSNEEWRDSSPSRV